MTIPDRPRPLQEAADDATQIHGMWMGISTAVVSAGLISLTASNLIAATLGIVPGLLAMVSTALGAHVVVRAGEPLVTPVTDPRDNDGHPLVSTPPDLT